MSSKSKQSGLSKEKELPEVKVIIKRGPASLQQNAAWSKFWQKLISEANDTNNQILNITMTSLSTVKKKTALRLRDQKNESKVS